MNKANETAWLIISIICFLMAIYFGVAFGIKNQDTIIMSFATIISVIMYTLRRAKRLKTSKK